jgi:hypothetical protein
VFKLVDLHRRYPQKGRRWGSWSGDRELEGMRKDTVHNIYTGSGCQGGEPYVLFGGSSMAPCAWCWVEIRCPARYLPSFI